VLCLRFGAVASRETAFDPNGLLHTILTLEDLARLMVACIEAPDDLRYGVFHALSNNRWNRLDISETRSVLGYMPEDDAFALVGVFPPA
jgi:hypothetical protein